MPSKPRDARIKAMLMRKKAVDAEHHFRCNAAKDVNKVAKCLNRPVDQVRTYADELSRMLESQTTDDMARHYDDVSENKL